MYEGRWVRVLGMLLKGILDPVKEIAKLENRWAGECGLDRSVWRPHRAATQQDVGQCK